MNSVVIQPPSVEGGIPAEVSEMLKKDGLYIGSDPNRNDGRFVPILVINGLAYSMKTDAVLVPTRFIPGTQLDGPFRPTLSHEKHEVSKAN